MKVMDVLDMDKQVAFEQKLLWLLLAGCLTMFAAASGWGFNVLLETNQAVTLLVHDVEIINQRLDRMERKAEEKE